ncbi:MAG: LysM peptidoglycan-binding domain-containing protein [Opitutales bacterium]
MSKSARYCMGGEGAGMKLIPLLCVGALLSGCVSTGGSSKESGPMTPERVRPEAEIRESVPRKPKRADPEEEVEALVFHEGKLIPFRVRGVTFSIERKLQPEARPVTANVYLVKRGDTLSRIARTHGTSVTALKDVNNLRSDLIRVGQRLLVPPAERPFPIIPSD